ncbi:MULTISPECIES: hypothetical protein [unclassified Yoonia]|uniref:hypothetical protein n=1 Tax=unclassified Yoonia TaxID=2629118 RepID=UPI002AFED816|nr:MULTISPECIES: hypothetical protein [unclassified Yoonia]
MEAEAFMFFVVLPACVAALAGWLSFWCGRRRLRWGIIGLSLALVGLAVAMLVGLEVARGLDGLVYLAGLMLIVAPAGLGVLLGGIVGWQRKDAVPPDAQQA